jgi:hypothetical protein
MIVERALAADAGRWLASLIRWSGRGTMAVAQLNTQAIYDWQSFHEESRRAFGFPDF